MYSFHGSIREAGALSLTHGQSLGYGFRADAIQGKLSGTVRKLGSPVLPSQPCPSESLCSRGRSREGWLLTASNPPAVKYGNDSDLVWPR